MTPQRSASPDARPFAARLGTYLAERFPVTSQGALVVLFALSCVCFGALTRTDPGPPSVASILVAVIVVWLFFFELRVADEHRDAEQDRRLRPELPVPRGVISLRELDICVLGAMAIQTVLTAALHPPLLALLLAPWLWTWLVRQNFFAGRMLRRRPLVSLVWHLVFFPLVALYAVCADQLPVAEKISPIVAAFVLLAALAAAGMEFARKSVTPEAERAGLVTYSALWGPRRAGMAVALAVGANMPLAFLCFIGTQASPLWFLPAIAAGGAAFFAAAFYGERPTPARARRVLLLTAVWTASAYGLLGIAPLLLRHAADASL